MYTVTNYPQGTFSWADNSSTHTEKSKTFYKQLFGWEIHDIPMGEGMSYTMFQLEGHDVCGMGPMMEEQQKLGIPSHWECHVKVDDVDALQAVVKEHGAKVLVEPFDVFDSGRMMLIQDPTGGVIAFWQPINHIGAGVVNKPGAMLWNELATRDVEAAKTFYANVLGWEYRVDENNYTTILNKGRYNGGIIQMDEKWGDMPPAWSVYFNIEDLDKAIASVPELGGHVHMGRTSAGDVGDFALIADPAGAVFYIMESKNYEAWEQ